MALLSKKQVSGKTQLIVLKILENKIRPDDTAVLDGAFLTDGTGEYKTETEGLPAGRSWLGAEYSGRYAGVLDAGGGLGGRYPGRRDVSLVRAFLKSEIMKSGACEVRPHDKISNLQIITDHARAKFTRLLPKEQQEAALSAINSGSLKKVMSFTTSMDDKGNVTKTDIYRYNNLLVRKMTANLCTSDRNVSLDGIKIENGKEYVQFAEPAEFLTTDKDEYIVDRYGISSGPFDTNGKTDISQNPDIATFEQEFEKDSLQLGLELQRIRGIQQKSTDELDNRSIAKIFATDKYKDFANVAALCVVVGFDKDDKRIEESVRLLIQRQKSNEYLAVDGDNVYNMQDSDLVQNIEAIKNSLQMSSDVANLKIEPLEKSHYLLTEKEKEKMFSDVHGKVKSTTPLYKKDVNAVKTLMAEDYQIKAYLYDENFLKRLGKPTENINLNETKGLSSAVKTVGKFRGRNLEDFYTEIFAEEKPEPQPDLVPEPVVKRGKLHAFFKEKFTREKG